SVDINAYLEVVFDGDTPKTSWWEYLQQWLDTNWPLMALGFGGAMLGGVASVYLAKPER
ncbi:unnamed protein product, partial [marine sediment metagenome]